MARICYVCKKIIPPLEASRIIIIDPPVDSKDAWDGNVPLRRRFCWSCYKAEEALAEAVGDGKSLYSDRVRHSIDRFLEGLGDRER